ncbi:MAG: hypothetical protein JJE16_02815 [Nitrospiraceae bacterium]|nr:hypothetical protein [Nitrospiraceae bacterium]
MKMYRIVTLAVVGLFLSVSFIASPVVAAEKDGVMMKGGKMVVMHDGKEINRMDRATTMSNGTMVTMKGKMVTKGGKEMSMTEGQMVMMDGKVMDGKKMEGNKMEGAMSMEGDAGDKDMKMEEMHK